MRAILAIALAAGLLLNGSSVKAAEVRVLDGAGTGGIKLIAVTGELEVGDERLFSNIAVQAKSAVVLFDSPGGSVPAAIQIGKAIRLEGFATVVPEGNTCVSACALAWLGGVVRYMGNSARVGFHAAYINTSGEKQVSSVANALIGGYLNGLGYSESAIAYFTSAPPEGLRWLTFGDAARIGIEVRNLADVQQKETTVEPKVAPKATVQQNRQIFRVASDVSEGILNMRNGPGTRHALVTAIPAGSENVQQIGPCVEADDRISRHNWCNVEWNGKIGWVSMIGLEASQGKPRSVNSSQAENIATSLWNHNGSIMRLSASGTARTIAYERPREGMQQVGVRKGDVLFEGTRDGSAIKGLARIFSPACGVLKYEVNGLVAEGDTRIELIGFAPVLNGSCNQIATKRDFLVFEYVGRHG